MRPENNPLDLNNFPDEYSRDGKQLLQDSSSSGCRKKKNSSKDDESEKVYECRFCSLKFCKSQALGGHMNRHRQERETETLNHARQLVYRNDHNLSTQPAPNLGYCQPIASGGYHPASNMGNMADPTMHARFSRYMSDSASASSSFHVTPPPPQHQLQQPSQHFVLASPPPPPPIPFPSPYSHHHYAVNDYYVGNVLNSSLNDYTYIGSPVGQALVGGGKDRSLQTPQEETLNWGRGYSGTQLRLDTPSATNRCHDRF